MFHKHALRIFKCLRSSVIYRVVQCQFTWQTIQAKPIMSLERAHWTNFKTLHSRFQEYLNLFSFGILYVVRNATEFMNKTKWSMCWAVICLNSLFLKAYIVTSNVDADRFKEVAVCGLIEFFSNLCRTSNLPYMVSNLLLYLIYFSVQLINKVRHLIIMLVIVD